MDAKCPHCKSGCEHCEDGFIQVQFARGRLYTKKCSDPKCGFENGGRITGEGLPPITDDLGDPMDCIICKAEASWVPVEEALEGETVCVSQDCKSAATYDSPTNYCDIHWLEWFNCAACTGCKDCPTHKKETS